METGLKTVSFHFDNGTMEPTASGCWYRRTGPPCTAQARTGSCGWKAQFDTSRAESSKLFGEITNSADMAGTKHASQTTTTIQLSDFQFVFDSLVLRVGVINNRLSHPCKTSPLYQRPSTKNLSRQLITDGCYSMEPSDSVVSSFDWMTLRFLLSRLQLGGGRHCGSFFL